MIESNLENYSQAQKHLKIAIKVNPQNYENYLLLGIAYFYLKDYTASKKLFLKTIELSKKDYRAFFNLGQLQATIGQADQAVINYTKAIRLNDSIPSLYMSRAATYEEKKALQLAIDDYTAPIQLNPKYATAYLLRGYIYLDLGKKTKACQDLNKAQKFGEQIPKNFQSVCKD